MKGLVTVAAVAAFVGVAIFVVKSKRSDADRFWTVVSMRKDGKWSFVGFERTPRGAEIRASGDVFANQQAARVAADAWTSSKIAELGGSV